MAKKAKKIKKSDVVSKVLDDCDGLVSVGDTVEEVLYTAGRRLDKEGGVEGTAIFKLKGHKGWFVGSQEFHIANANPKWVALKKAEQAGEAEDVG